MKECGEKENDKVVIQSYKLTTIRENFGLYGQRTLLRIVESVQEHIEGLSFKDKKDIRKIDTSIDTDKWGDKLITIDLRSICSEGVNKFEPVRRELRQLMNLHFEYEDENTWEAMNFLNHVKVDKGSWKVVLKVSKDVWKVLMDFSAGFRRIEIEKAMQFQSRYSLRFYTLFAGQYKPICYRIDELKKMFNLETKYTQNGMFIKRVVDVAKKELDMISPYTFDYVINYVETARRGRPEVSSLTFFPIHCVTKHTGLNSFKDRLSIKTILGSDVYKILTQKFGISEKSINNNLTLIEYANQKIELVDFLIKIAPKVLRAKNITGYVINSIKIELKQKVGVQFM